MLTFDKLKPMLVELANTVTRETTGSLAEIRAILDLSDLAFGIWQDADETLGVGTQIIKGRAKLGDIALMEGIATGSVSMRIVAIPCTCLEHAEALRRIAGELNH